MKLLVIGFDGLEPEFFRSYVPSGYELHPLYSPQPFTPTAWMSIYTGGLSAEEHGYSPSWFDFLHVYKRRKRPTCFWNILCEHGFTVELMNLPCTYPPDIVSGYMVCGFPLPNFSIKNYAYPESVVEKLPSDFVQHMDLIQWAPEKPYEDWANYVLGMGEKEFMDRVRRDNEVLIDTFEKLHSDSADLGFIQFSFVDRVAHLVKPAPGHYSESALHESLKMVAEIIQLLDKTLTPEAVLIVSDHGLRRLSSSETSDRISAYTHSNRGTLCYRALEPKCQTVRDIFNFVVELFKGHAPRPGGRGVKPLRDQEAWK